MPVNLNEIIRHIEHPSPAVHRGVPESPVIIAAIDSITHAAEAKAAREIGAVGRNRRGGAPNEIEK